MSQSRKASAAEAIINVLVGYGVAVAAQTAIFPMFGLSASASEHMAIAGLFTVISLIRSYILRRLFNQLTRRANDALTTTSTTTSTADSTSVTQ